jgi:hypothetical protein
MRTPEGDNIGIFCVLDNKPRKEFTEEDRAQLKELTAMVMRELQGGVQQVCGSMAFSRLFDIPPSDKPLSEIKCSS